MDAETRLTALINAAQEGDPRSLAEVFEEVYPTLRRISRARRRGWVGNRTLDTTALVHEAYMKLARAPDFRFKSRGHFFATFSKAMRQALITYAEKQRAEKRGGDRLQVTLGAAADLGETDVDDTWADLVSLDSALSELEELDERQARVVECLFFAGLGIAETAEALEVSPATVKRDWAAARAWLYATLRHR